MFSLHTRPSFLGSRILLFASAVCFADSYQRIFSTQGSAIKWPALFVPHGGGPLPILGDPAHESLTKYLREAAKDIPPPTAIVVVSAHWEAAQPTITSHPTPPLVYDYSGFPDESYRLQYPAPGHPQLASRVKMLIDSHLSGIPEYSGIKARLDSSRGFDHGMFVPLMLMYPEANIPCVQLSLVKGMSPRLHIEMGKAIESLREEGVLIFASGLSFHNMEAFFTENRLTLPKSIQFDDWLHKTCQLPSASDRIEQLANWTQAPQARFCHPREEHLIPLHVVAGASANDPCEVVYNDVLLGTKVSALRFGLI